MRRLPLRRAPEALREALRHMLLDLEDRRLEVGLAPAPDQRHYTHCIRVVQDTNPDWYRELLAAFPRGRRRRAARYTDSSIKRDDVSRIINRLLGPGTRSALAPHLLETAAAIREDWVARYGLTAEEDGTCLGCTG
ncbi:MAG: hypothetical protein AB7D57_06715 [Desulfovibrionaceae bacterium]